MQSSDRVLTDVVYSEPGKKQCQSDGRKDSKRQVKKGE